MARCLKCIKQDEGIDYVPEGDDIDLPEIAYPSIATYSEPITPDDIKITLEKDKPEETKVKVKEEVKPFKAIAD